MKGRIKLISSIVLVGMLLTLTGVAWAEEPSERGGLLGQVMAIEGDTILVSTMAGEECWVLTDEDTRFRIPGVREPTIDHIDVGDYIGARGERNEDGDLVAATVVVLPAEHAYRRNVVRGEVLAIDDLTLMVRTDGGERLVVTDELTRFRIPGVEDPSIEDISVGDPILAIGRLDEEGNLLARVVAVASGPQLRRHTLRGVITSIEGDSLGLATRGRQVRVVTTEDTIFRIPGVEDPGIDDLEVGDKVGVLVAPTEEGTLLAKVVVVRRDTSSVTSAIMAPIEATTALIDSLPWGEAGNVD